MKTLFAAVLFTAFGTTAFAQLGAVSSVQASAKILKQITLTPENVNFGTIASGGQPTDLTPTGVSEVNVGFTASQGRLVIDATSDEPIRVTFDSIVKLVHTTPAFDSIMYVPYLSATFGTRTVGHADQATSVLVNNVVKTGGMVATEPGGLGRGPFAIIYTDTALANIDQTTLFIGGTLFAKDGTSTIGSGNTSTGTYVGTLNFNVIYQ